MGVFQTPTDSSAHLRSRLALVASHEHVHWSYVWLRAEGVQWPQETHHSVSWCCGVEGLEL